MAKTNKKLKAEKLFFADLVKAITSIPGYEDEVQGLNLFVWGQPGFGKTSAFSQSIKEAGYTPMVYSLASFNEEKLSGLPVVKAGENVADEIPLRILMESTRLDEQGRPYAVFFDDLPSAASSTQKAALSLILEHTFGWNPKTNKPYNLKHVPFIAAGNYMAADQEDSLPPNFANRFVHFHQKTDSSSDVAQYETEMGYVASSVSAQDRTQLGKVISRFEYLAINDPDVYLVLSDDNYRKAMKLSKNLVSPSKHELVMDKDGSYVLDRGLTKEQELGNLEIQKEIDLLLEKVKEKLPEGAIKTLEYLTPEKAAIYAEKDKTEPIYLADPSAEVWKEAYEKQYTITAIMLSEYWDEIMLKDYETQEVEGIEANAFATPRSMQFLRRVAAMADIYGLPAHELVRLTVGKVAAHKYEEVKDSLKVPTLDAILAGTIDWAREDYQESYLTVGFNSAARRVQPEDYLPFVKELERCLKITKATNPYSNIASILANPVRIIAKKATGKTAKNQAILDKVGQMQGGLEKLNPEERKQYLEAIKDVGIIHTGKDSDSGNSLMEIHRIVKKLEIEIGLKEDPGKQIE